MLSYAIRLCFVTYTLLLVLRIAGSWFPSLSHTQFMRFIAHYTDPYLNLFRRFLPPLWGVLDLSPLLAYLLLQMAQHFLLWWAR
jgi:YggT family protein